MVSRVFKMTFKNHSRVFKMASKVSIAKSWLFKRRLRRQRVNCAASATFETDKDRRVKMKALFKHVVKFEQFDPLLLILGEIKCGPYCCKLKFHDFGGS